MADRVDGRFDLGRMAIVIDQLTCNRVSVSISDQEKNPASPRTVNGPCAPARRTRAMSSSTKRSMAPIGGTFAQPGVQHLPGVGPGGK